MKKLILFVAILLALTAAYMSIFGLTSLLKGSIYAIGIMAILLETAKVLNITYLHNNWKKIKLLHKIFIFITTVILLVITSSGVFGFLKSSSIETLGKVKKQELYEKHSNQKISFFTDTKSKIDSQKIDYQNKLNEIQKLLNNINTNQVDASILNDTTSKFWAKYNILSKNIDNTNKLKGELQHNIKNYNNIIDSLNSKSLTLQDSIFQLELKISNLQNDNIHIKQELGPFYSFAQLIYGKEILSTKELETTINWYIFILIFVFDPTAVSLILIYLNLSKKNKNDIPLKDNIKHFKTLSNLNSNQTSEQKNNNSKLSQNKQKNILNKDIKEKNVIGNKNTEKKSIDKPSYKKQKNQHQIKTKIEKQNKNEKEKKDFSFKNADVKQADSKLKKDKFQTWWEIDSSGAMKQK